MREKGDQRYFLERTGLHFILVREKAECLGFIVRSFHLVEGIWYFVIVESFTAFCNFQVLVLEHL